MNSTSIIGKSIDTFMVEEGTLSYEESAEGYIIRDEKVLKGNNYSNGISQIVTDNSRVAKGKAVFRYYSNNEENLRNIAYTSIEKLDEALQNSKEKIFTNIDMANIETEIKQILEEMYAQNSMQTIKEYKKRLNTYVVKKAEIAGENSPAGSYIKNLVEQRANLTNQLANDSEIIIAPNPGLISYRVDGLEEVLNCNNEDFSYLTTELLNSFNLEVGSSIPESNEAGKLVNNYVCYVACPISTENSEIAEVGEKLTLRFADMKEVSAEIVKINEEGNRRVIIFKITENIENLLEYRKVSFEIVWWKYSGWKISNSALIEKDDATYIKRTKAGVEEEILVKVLRQNDTYSIVENYKDEELNEMGYTLEQIQEFPKIKLYDEIKIQK